MNEAARSAEDDQLLMHWFAKAVRTVYRMDTDTRQDLEDAAGMAIEDMVRAVKPSASSYAYVRRATGSNLKKVARKRRTQHGGQEPEWLDDPKSLVSPHFEDSRLNEREGESWCEDLLGLLTPHQREVMKVAMSGFGNKEIALKLGVSPDAVRRTRCDVRSDVKRKLFPGGEYKRSAVPAVIPGRSLRRAGDEAMAAAASLAVARLDLRTMPSREREDITGKVTELEHLLRRCPPEALDAQGAAALCASLSTIAAVLIADRNEQAALQLTRAARPHLDAADDHPAVFKLQRAHAEAAFEAGFPVRSLLLGLSEKERQVFGADHPMTALLLLWAQAIGGGPSRAEVARRHLGARLVQAQTCAAPLLLHMQCRDSWLQGMSGHVKESAAGYDRVIFNRSRILGPYHREVLDARHSKHKMLVINGYAAQAVADLWDVANDRAHVQGDTHSDTLETLKYFHLARTQAEPDDDRELDDAIAGLEQILAVQTRRHGPRYPMCRDTAAQLSALRTRREALRLHVPAHGKLTRSISSTAHRFATTAPTRHIQAAHERQWQK